MHVTIRTLLLIGISLWLTCHSIFAQELEDEVRFCEPKSSLFYKLRKIGNTSLFQGNRKEKKYFEGWYFKMVAADGAHIISVIPGISLSSDGQDKHAFIQIIDGVTAQTSYFSFPIESFSFSKKRFEIKIGENYFSKDELILNIKSDTSVISGKVKMSNSVEYRSKRLLNAGIMGWYRFVPYMQCYHGVVSLTNNLQGQLTIDNINHDFRGGKGYIEKDWGSGMPSSWIWMQSNHFNEGNSSFMLSIANIPWRGKSFNGFLGFFYLDEKIYHFSTYRPSKLQLEVLDSNNLNIKIKNRKHTFLIEASSKSTGLLKAPVEGAMDRRIPESIDATLKITMLDKKGTVLFKDSTHIAGLEMVGGYEGLQGILK